VTIAQIDKFVLLSSSYASNQQEWTPWRRLYLSYELSYCRLYSRHCCRWIILQSTSQHSWQYIGSFMCKFVDCCL